MGSRRQELDAQHPLVQDEISVSWQLIERRCGRGSGFITAHAPRMPEHYSMRRVGERHLSRLIASLRGDRRRLILNPHPAAEGYKSGVHACVPRSNDALGSVGRF